MRSHATNHYFFSLFVFFGLFSYDVCLLVILVGFHWGFVWAVVVFCFTFVVVVVIWKIYQNKNVLMEVVLMIISSYDLLLLLLLLLWLLQFIYWVLHWNQPCVLMTEIRLHKLCYHWQPTNSFRQYGQKHNWNTNHNSLDRKSPKVDFAIKICMGWGEGGGTGMNGWHTHKNRYNFLESELISQRVEFF